MEKHEIETRLADGVQDAVPDILTALLTKWDEHPERNTIMNTSPSPSITVSPSKKRHGQIIRWVAVAAVLLLTVSTFLISRFYATDSVISIDVNPSIEIRANQSSKVLAATARGTDAQLILEGLELKGSDLDKAMDTILLLMIQHGYISDIQNSVLISVESSRSQDASTLKQTLSEKASQFLQTNSVNAAVIGQTLPDDEALKALATQYNISLGKAALIDLLIQQDPRYVFESFVDSSINDILLLLQAKQTDLSSYAPVTSNGQASNGSYIGEDAAKATALQAAGVAESQASFLRLHLDWDDGRMVYEVDFVVENVEYEYEIDAVTGQIVEYDTDYNHSNGSAGGNSSGNASTPTTPPANSGSSSPAAGNYIGDSAALSVALQHAGLSADSVFAPHVEFDWDDGRAEYDVEFHYSGIEYEYELDAVTGAILQWDTDYDD